MGTSPVIALTIVMLTLTFEGLLFGEELAEKSFPDLIDPAHESQDCDGFFDGFVCAIETVLSYIGNFFIILFGAIVFIINAITFNVAGAPWFVRVPMGTLMGTMILWPAVTLFRGN
jgi:hypothetical protein